MNGEEDEEEEDEEEEEEEGKNDNHASPSVPGRRLWKWKRRIYEVGGWGSLSTGIIHQYHPHLYPPTRLLW